MLNWLLKSDAEIKLLDFFLDKPELDYTIPQLEEETKITWKSVKKAIPRLLMYDIIVPSRKVGKSQAYKLKADSEIFKALKQFDYLISDRHNNVQMGKDYDKEYPFK